MGLGSGPPSTAMNIQQKQVLKSALPAENRLVLPQRFWEKRVKPLISTPCSYMKRRPHSQVLAFLVLLIAVTAGAQSVSTFNTNNGALGISAGSGNLAQRTGALINGSNVVTALATTADLVSGMIVTGGGIPGNTVITKVVSATSVELSLNSTTSSTQTLTFLSPWNFSRNGNVTAGLDEVTNLLTTVDMVPGMKLVGNGINGVVSIVEILSPTSIRISAPAATTFLNQPYTFVAATTAPGPFARTGTIQAAPGGPGLNIITLASTAGIPVGTIVTGPGLSGTVRVDAILSATTLRLSAQASADQTSQSYTFAPVYYGPNTAGHTATINLDFSPGRSIGGVTKDFATVAGGTLAYSGTLDSDPMNTSLSVNVVDAATGVASFMWSQARGSSVPSAYAVTYNEATRQVNVTFTNVADTNANAGRVLRASYTRTTLYTNKQIGDHVDRIGLTNGSTTTFGPVTLTHQPTVGSLTVSDGTYMWSELRGTSTNPKDFSVTWNSGSKQVTVTYGSAALAPSGRVILATYARAGAAPVTLGALQLGDISGGEQLGLRVNSLTMQNVGGAQAQINKIVGGDDEIVSGINLASTTALAVRTGGGGYDSFKIGGEISGTGSLIKLDSGNLTLMGNNSYTGNTYIRTTGGTTFLRSPTPNGAIPGTTLFLGNSNRDGNASSVVQLEASNQINDNATVWIDAVSGRHGYIKMMGFNETIGRLIDYTGQGVIENTESENGVAGVGTLTIGGNQDSYYNGYMRSKVVGNNTSTTSLSTGDLALVKNGTGMMTLAGGQISYTGNTTVNAGTLRLFNITNPLGNLPPITPGGTTFYNGNTAPRFDSDITNNAKVELSATTDWRVGTVISGTGSVVKTGANTVTLVNENTYSGQTSVENGTLRLQSGARNYVKDQNENYVLDGGRLVAIEGSGRLLNTSKINLLGGNLVIFNEPAKNENDNVAGYGRLNDTAEIESRGGTFNFAYDLVSGTANYSENAGALRINGGHLNLTATRNNEGQTSLLTFQTLTHTKGGTIGLTGTGIGGVLDGSTLTVDTRNQVKLTAVPGFANGILGGWATTTNSKVRPDGTVVSTVDWLTYNGSGVLQAYNNYFLSNTANVTTNQNSWGNTAVAAGANLNVLMSTNTTLNTNRFINSLKIESTGGRTLNLRGGSGTPTQQQRTLTIGTGGIISRGTTHNISNGFLTAGNGGQGQYELFVHVGDATGRTLTINSAIRDNGSNPVTIVKNGIGQLELRGANTHTGGTIVNQGVIEVQTIGALGGGNIAVPDPDFLTLDGGTVRVPSPAGTVTQTMVFETNRGIVVGPRHGIFALNPRTQVIINSPVSGPGDFVMGGIGGSDGVLQLAGTNTFEGRIKVDFGTLELTGGTNTFKGGVSIEGGAFVIKDAGALPTKTDVNIVTGSMSVAKTATIGSLNGAGSINSGSSASPVSLIVDQESNTSYGGIIGDAAGSALSLEKRGNGILRLTGSNSTYRGATRILGGVLTVARMGTRDAPPLTGSSLGLGSGDLDRTVNSAQLLEIADGAALSYVGTFPSVTNRPFTIGTGSLGASIMANGGRVGDVLVMTRGALFIDPGPGLPVTITGYDALAFSQPNQHATLNLGGLNTGNNRFEHILTDNGAGVLNLTKTGTGRWIIGEIDPGLGLPAHESTYSGQTTIYGGSLSVISNKALGAAGGPSVNLIGGSLDIDTLYESVEELAMMGGRLRTMNAPNGAASWGGGIRFDVSSTIEVRDNQTLTVKGVISGTSSLRKEGFGTLVLAANNTLRGGTTVAEGTLRLDFSTNTLSKLSDGAGIALGGGREGGTLDIVGGTAVSPNNAREDVSSLTLNQGLSRITRSDINSTTTIRLNGFGINQGGALDIQKNNIAQTDRSNIGGILGAWATVGGTDWASNERNGNDGNIVAFGTGAFPQTYSALPSSGYLANTWLPGAQTTVTANSSVTDATTNSLRFNNNLSTTLTLSGDNNIVSNGILQTLNVGTNTNLITGGRIQLNHYREGGNLTIHQNNAAGGLRIASEISNGPTIHGVLVDFSSGSQTLNVTAGSTSGLTAGMPISGVGIPAGALITGVTATQIDIDLPTTGTGTGLAPHLDGISPLTVSFAANSATVTVTANAAQLANLHIGMPITHPNVPAGTTITGINYNPTGTSTFFLSRNAVSALSGQTPVFGGQNNLVAQTTAGSGTLNVISGSVLDLYIGMPVSGPGIQDGSIITGFNNNTSFNISLAATATSNAMVPVVSPRNGVVKSGPGILFLAGQNTFTGPVSVVGGTLSLSDINNAGVPGPLGMSSSSFNNIVIGGGTLQYTGNTTTTDRGFKINEVAAIDVALSGTRLSMEGNLSGGDGLAEGRLVKTGGGILNITRTVLTGGATNILQLEVQDGKLELEHKNANGDALAGVNNRFASTNAGVTMGGGVLELIGLEDTLPPSGTNYSENRVQSLFGDLILTAGASEIRVTAANNTTTTLELQNPGNPTNVTRLGGSAVNLVENPNGGTAVMRIAVPAIEQSTPISWATFLDTSDLSQPGVNNFAAIEPADDGVISADSKNLYRIIPNAGQWLGASGGVVSEGSTPFSGTTESASSVFALRYFNTAASTVTVFDNLHLAGGAILVGAHVGNTTKKIQGGFLTSDLLVEEIQNVGYYSSLPLLGNGKLYNYDLIVHNYNPVGRFEIASPIWDNPIEAPNMTNNEPRYHPVSFVHVGDGSTHLTAANLYTGTTYANSGTIVLDHANALPGGVGTTGGESLLRFEGGVVGLGVSTPFTRSLGTARSNVQWTASGGFAAFGGTRDVNLGGAAAEVTWGVGGFVPDGNSLIFSASDATGTLRFLNPIDLGGARRQFIVHDGTAGVDADLMGALTGLGGSLHKLGEGTLRVSGAGTHTRGTFLSEGTLIINEVGLGTGSLEIGTTSNTSGSDRLRLVLSGGNVLGQTIVGNLNSGGITHIRATQNTNLNGGLAMSRRVMIDPSSTRALNVIGDIAGGSMTVAGGGTVALRGTWTGAAGNGSDSNFDGGVVVRHGTILAGANNALGSGVAVDLGDRVGVGGTGSVHRSSAGRSVMETGGVFDATSNGNPGSTSGSGAFIYANRNTLTLDGYTYGAADVGRRILVDGESNNPERNGIYEVRYFQGPTGALTDDIISLVRVADFDQSSEIAYGGRIAVSSGSYAGRTYHVATSGSVPNVTPIYFKEETSLNPNISLLVDAPGITISNDIDINSTNGTGVTTIGGALSLGGGTSNMSGNITLQDIQSGVAENRTVRLLSETSDGRGIVLSGQVTEIDQTASTGDTLSFIKEGLGTLTLTGDNTFRGNITVESGSLLISNTSGSGSGLGTLTVNNTGSLLGGNGTIAGATTINAGGILSPGDPTSGLVGVEALSFGNNLTLANDTSMFFNLKSNTDYDKVDVAGLLNVGTGVLVQVILDYLPTTSAVFNLLDWGSLAVSGGLGDGLDLPTLAVSSLYWDTSLFDNQGVLEIKVNSGSGPPPVSFAVKEARVDEGVQTVTVALQTNWVPLSNITVPFTYGGTASRGAGLDFTAPNSITIPAGTSTATLTLTILNDPVTESEEKIIVRLGVPTGGLKGSPATFTLTVRDNDSGADVGQVWTLRNPLPTNESIMDVAHSGTLAVAVGTYGTVMTSSDGVTWTRRAIPVINDLQAVTWTGVEWVAVGTNGLVLTSEDGIVWILRSVSTSATLRDVVWTGSNLIAVGQNGSVYVSVTDYASDNEKLAWTLMNTGTSADLHAVAFNGTGFLAVGTAGTMVRSFDGSAWTSFTEGSADLFAVSAKSDLFVVSGAGGVRLSSADLLAWGTGDVGVASDMNVLHWNGTIFLAGGAGGVLRSSTDGLAWTNAGSAVTERLDGMTFGAGLWIAVGDAGAIETSSNGTTWTDRSPGPGKYLESVTRTATQFVAVGRDAGILTSPDGITWTPRTPPAGVTQRLRGVASSATLLVAVGEVGRIITSTDGVTWTQVTSGTGEDLHGITFAGGLFVAVGANGAIVTSANGSTWNVRNSTVVQLLEDVVGTGSQFVAVGATGTVLNSSDGIAWTEASVVPSTTTFNDVAWTGTQYIAVGVGGTVLTSSDGSVWVRRTTGVTTSLENIVWAGTRAMVVGVDGVALESANGSTWTRRQTGTGKKLEGIAFAASPLNRLVAVGADGTILTSEYVAPPPPQVFFTLAAQSVKESAGVVNVVVNLNPVADVDVKVPVSVQTGGTAAKTSDYTMSLATLLFTKGQSTKNIAVTVKNDGTVEPDESFTIVLGTPVPVKTTTRPPVLSSPVTHAFTILNDDEALAVTTPPMQQIIPLGASLALNAVATGGDKAAIQWRKNGANISGAVTAPTANIGEFTSAYNVAAAATSNGGRYDIKVSNPTPAASVISTSAEVMVIDQVDRPFPVRNATSAVMKVVAGGSSLTYRWHKVGVGPLNDGGDIVGVTTPTLTIKTFGDPGEEGIYRCEVTCASGTPDLVAFSGNFDAKVAAQPDITSPTTATGGNVTTDMSGTTVTGVVGTLLSFQVPYSSDAAKAPTSFTSTKLPVGLTLNAKTGVISGIPTAATNPQVSVTVTVNNPSTIPDLETFFINILPVAPGAIGKFAALVDRNTPVNGGLGARMEVTSTAKGSFTGSLFHGTTKYTFKGALNTILPNPTGTATITRKAPLQNIVIDFTVNPNTNLMTGTVTVGSDVANLNGWRNVWTSVFPATAHVGRHNVAADLGLTDVGDQSKPQGTSYASVVVNALTGSAVVTGKAADGSALTTTAPLSPSGQAIVYTALYTNTGSVHGLVTLAADAGHTAGGTLTWSKNAQSGTTRSYRAGWPLPINLAVSGGLYAAPLSPQIVLNLTDGGTGTINALLALSEGGVQLSSTNPNVSLRVKSLSTTVMPVNNTSLGNANPNPAGTTLKITASTGAFSGTCTLKDTAGKRTVKFFGLIIPDASTNADAFEKLDGIGAGYFTLNQLPDSNVLPPTTLSNSPILSGQVIVDKLP